MELVQLLYVCTAAPGLAPAAVVEIHRAARDRNAGRNVTGLLLYASGNFLQLLEGPPAAVNDLYARIARDPRHANVRVLLTQPASRRIFPNWSMGLVEVDGRSPVDVARFRAILDQAGPPGGGPVPANRNLQILACMREFRAQLGRAA